MALRKALTEAADIEQLFAIWERNVDAVRAINKQTNRSTPRGVIAQNLVAHMKGRAIALAKQGSQPSAATSDNQNGSRPKVDKSVLAIAEPKRIRSKSIYVLSPANHASSVGVLLPTHTMSVMHNREAWHLK